MNRPTPTVQASWWVRIVSGRSSASCFESSSGRKHVEVEDPAEAVVGDEEHGTVEGGRLRFYVEAVVAADEVDAQAPERQGGGGQDVGHSGVGVAGVDVVQDSGQHCVGETSRYRPVRRESVNRS